MISTSDSHTFTNVSYLISFKPNELMGSLQRQQTHKQATNKNLTLTMKTQAEAILEVLSTFKNHIIILVGTISKYF